MAYFCPHRKRHERVFQSCATHGHVAWPCVPCIEIKIKSVCSTRFHTRACDLAVLHKSVYPTGLARPSTWLAHGLV
ncbi:hypothetical protein F383_29811 [Gossypium arboreum]|uniref:Uncharacterized protein n=1 Tax=Gossypium arboreum TaxID=29729 RepID=A0A0B0MXY3_GOSAR|nr:hypothetical protein F383_29811 [Gossypium arboreum]